MSIVNFLLYANNIRFYAVDFQQTCYHKQHRHNHRQLTNGTQTPLSSDCSFYKLKMPSFYLWGIIHHF